MRDDSIRRIVANRLREDLIGPIETEEVIDDLPSDRYLTGILFPPRTAVGAEQADESETADNDAEGSSGPESIPGTSAFRPSAAGLSFALRPGDDGIAGVIFEISAGRYVPIERQNSAAPRKQWHRVPLHTSFEEILEATDKPRVLGLGGHGIPGLELHLRVKDWCGQLLVTAALVNVNAPEEPLSREKLEESTFFQVSMAVVPILEAEFCRKPDYGIRNGDDPEAESSALIYKEVGEYAVGHTCSADWAQEGERITSVRTQWIPAVVVKKSIETGDAVFDTLSGDAQRSPLNTRWLSEADPEELVSGLRALPTRYSDWINRREADVADLEREYASVGNKHLEICRNAQHRIEAGIDLIERDAEARAAFQWANRAIWLQNRWKAERSGREDVDLVWRPFQLAFVLLCLCSASHGKDPERDTMDLLWFPTGGGKTEAYLLLTAYVIFLRRLRAAGDVHGAGVTAFMRYTLRLLTIQQFQRAAAMIVACDLVRRGAVSSGASATPRHFASDPPISIGLWVGDSSSPNRVEDAIEALDSGSASTPRQLSNCPVCDAQLAWGPPPDRSRIHVHCTNNACGYGSLKSPLPVWTVDEDIYREKPTLVIGTADKYVQLPRKGETGLLFGLGSNVGPPDLVIQDELHLISGPLGTMAGLYEIAVDELSARNGIRPKVIGSTATIRRADSQILALFNRKAFQFPPPGLHHSNSGFATLDPDDPGRLYLGVTTAGRSAKFTLQAVTASILQSMNSAAIPEGRRDEYSTLVTYFNSLRELGGALVLMRDDVGRSVEEYASRRSDEKERRLRPPIELTSRVTSSEIPDLLARLELDCGSEDGVDAVLATNMISVGVDVSRLAVMAVNGQPKGVAEYIQATSRVGRNKVPGLVVTVYNANKARDRSRYETFTNWHQSLYRDVEATSVTPFAPRARDRAIHAVLVAIVRHLVPGMQREPIEAGPMENEIRAVIDRIVARARVIDDEEARAVGDTLHAFLDRWIARGRIRMYWDDWGDNGLLMSAEKAAERAIGRRSARWAKASPNSLRSVEPSTAFLLRPDRSRREEQQ
ncbi:DNA/RNA helicase [Sinorhizobium fredii]|uniref:DNA/RNA helicase n=1 Tax=Rhizobium fredii TaxID=380 RepID=UPI003511AFA7